MCVCVGDMNVCLCVCVCVRVCVCVCVLVLVCVCVFAATATFDGKQHLLSLPVVNSVGYVLRFLKKLCRSLLCENLFSDQPIAPSSSGSSSSSSTSSSSSLSFHAEKLGDGQPKASMWRKCIF